MILNATREWECGRCNTTTQTPAGAATPMHNCPGFGLLSIPLHTADTRVVAVEREDYIAGERHLTMIDGRPIMAVRTDRADGSNDLTVYPGTATATAAVH